MLYSNPPIIRPSPIRNHPQSEPQKSYVNLNLTKIVKNVQNRSNQICRAGSGGSQASTPTPRGLLRAATQCTHNNTFDSIPCDFFTVYTFCPFFFLSVPFDIDHAPKVVKRLLYVNAHEKREWMGTAAPVIRSIFSLNCVF